MNWGCVLASLLMFAVFGALAFLEYLSKKGWW
jgi:hypothetical protein